MANIKSQIKRIKQNEKRHQRNKAVKSGLKTAVRKFREAADAGEKDQAVTLGQDAAKKLDKAASKGVIHKNQAANRKSAIAKKRRLALIAASRRPADPLGRVFVRSAGQLGSASSGSRRPVMVSTIRSSVYAASLALPLMSASASAITRIARAMPGSVQPRDWSRMVRSFQGGTPTSRASSASRMPRGADL